MEAYDSVWVLADAIKRAGSTDPKAIIAALENTDIEFAQGRYWFEYGSKKPLPADGKVPKYMWHQWPEPPLLVLEYFEAKQPGDQAAVLWPKKYRTHGVSYIPYGTKP